MFFRILGPVDVWDGQHSYPVGPWKQQCVLAILLLEAGRVVSAQTLAERVWDEQIPPRARETLQVYISRLRSQLRATGDHASMIISSAAGGYRLDAGRDQVDVRQFNHLLASARAAAGELNPQRARDLLVQADHLWRGEPLDGLNGQWADATRTALIERRRSALLTRIELDLQVGDGYDDAISELTGLTRVGRIDQNAIELLMRALAGRGRHDEALAAYRRAHARLRNELGAAPRPELTALHQQILRGDTSLTRIAAIRDVRRGALAPHTLDRDSAYLIGRDEAIHELTAAVTEDLHNSSGVALYALDGMPGIGKSAVAVRAAHLLASRCPGGALQVNLRTNDPRQPPLDPRTALILLLDALGTPTSEVGNAGSFDELAALWRRRTHGLRLLVLFDDVRDTEQITPLLPVTPGSVILLTSRRRLLNLPGARQSTLGPLSELGVMRLLIRVAGRRFPGQRRDLQRFSTHCAGLPLAVTVAGAHLRAHPTWSLGDLVDRLASPPPDAMQDQLTAPIYCAFAISYQALSDEHRRILRLVASQPGQDIGLHATAALADAAPGETDVRLELLVEHHLLEETSRHRYRLHDLLRTFAISQSAIEDAGRDIEAAIERIAQFYLAAAARAERTIRPHRRITARIPPCAVTDQLELEQPDGAQTWLDTEADNLLAIATYTDSGPPGPHSAAMACILAPYLDRRGLWPQAVETLERAVHSIAPHIARSPANPTSAQLYNHLAAAYARTRQLDTAARYATTALEAWRALSDQRGQADALLDLGRIHWYAHRLDQAITAYEQSKKIYQHLNQPYGQTLADYHRAIILFERGRHANALQVARHALDTVGHIDDPALECDVLINLGEMYRLTGQDTEARTCFQRARQLAHQHQDPQNLAALALNTGILHHRSAHYDTAETSLHTALQLFQALGDRGNQIDTLLALAATHRARHQLDDATKHLRDATDLADQLDDPQRRSRIELETGELLRLQQQPTAACDHFHTAINLATAASAPLEQAHAHQALGDTLMDLNDQTTARRHWRQAHTVYRELSHPYE